MINTNAMLLCDTYKTVHQQMYPNGLTNLVSYWVPRKSMFKNKENQGMVFFGLQAFVQEFLIDYFKENFFDLPEDEIVKTYSKYMNIQLGDGVYTTDKIIELHALGYLPLQIMSIPEGSIVNPGVPCIQLTNTNERFAWLVQWVECIMQAELWAPCNHATIGHMYYRLAKQYYGKTCDDSLDPSNAFSDFGMRGMSCMNEATHCSAAWLLSANKTSTITALPYLDTYYNADCSYNHIGIGAVSTEHSVISANNAYGLNEEDFLKKMLTEIYPTTSFSFLGDTYDYWNFVNNIIPNCKEEILQHSGKLLIRPDSGDMVEISLGTIQKLWDTFGGTINSKGYKVIDQHVGLIYGDGCTLNQVRKIWKELDSRGFASNNIVFGIGAFCFKAIFEGDKMIVNTRDTYGLAQKSTYGIINGKEIIIYKDPKTDENNLKKSHKGLVFVERVGTEFIATDGLMLESYAEFGKTHENALQCIFEDSRMIKKESFKEIRTRLQTWED